MYLNKYINKLYQLSKCLKSRHAFTLAEVLITLLIVGVIASIVIPGIIADTQQAELKTAFKKSYSDLDQATKRILIDNGGSLKGLFTSHNTVGNMFLNYLNYVKKCNTGESLGNCWHNDGNMKFYSGTAVIGWGDIAGAVLNNGNLVRFEFKTSNCTDTFFSGSIAKCGIIYIDVNGFKAPNTMGKDIFGIYITENGIKPYGIQGDGHEDDCFSQGWGCSSKYLYQ